MHNTPTLEECTARTLGACCRSDTRKSTGMSLTEGILYVPGPCTDVCVVCVVHGWVVAWLRDAWLRGAGPRACVMHV